MDGKSLKSVTEEKHFDVIISEDFSEKKSNVVML